MAKKPDVPCSGGCGKLLWSGPRSRPAAERLCTDCRAAGGTAQRPPVTIQEPAAEAELTFGSRGTRLWRDTTAERSDLSPAERVLLEETCRTADRLDRLDAFLSGREDSWMKFWRNDDGTTVKVVIDRALTEVRQQQDTFRGMVADLVKKQAAKAPEQPEASASDELGKRRAEARRAAGL